jgi:FkbM family methyltransferase
MESLDICLRGVNLRFSREHDWYPDSYYKDVANDSWEPMTVAFFERNVDSNTVLLDIGAATGVLSMFAAKLGAQVIAFEPNPVAMLILENNIRWNELEQSITALPEAVSDSESIMKFAIGSNSQILSPLVMHGIKGHENTEISVKNLGGIVNQYSQNVTKKLIIKMDIEGAEYKILKNAELIRSISPKVTKLYVSLHPGFNRMPKSKNKYLLFAFSVFNRPLEVIEHRKIFKNFVASGELFTCEGRKVTRLRVFAGLLFFGSLDWIWVPTKTKSNNF